MQMQMDLFSRPTLNITKTFKTACHDDAKACNLSRKQIVDKMNDLAEQYGVRLSHGNSNGLDIGTLEKWLNPADDTHRMPMRALPIFCAVTGRCSCVTVLTQPLGLMVIGPREQKMLAWAEAKMTIKQQNQLLRKLEGEL
jgi:hypothetical protein